MGEKYRPKTGDEVEVLLRGPASRVSSQSGHFLVGESDNGGNYITFDAPHVISIKKIHPPLPKTRGSVVKVTIGRTDVYLLLQEDGWMSWSRSRPWTEENITGYRHEVIFDAGVRQ